MRTTLDTRTSTLHLDQQLCFALYSSSRMIVQAYDEYLKELNITYPQYLVMMALWQNRINTIKDLGEILLLDSGTLSPMIKKLQLKGLVKKARSQADERIVFVELTAAGKVMQKAALKIPEQMLCKLSLKPKEFVELRGQLQNLAQVLKKD